MTICYDLRFPELYRMLAASGAEIISVPSAFTVPTTRDHWEILLRARAIENQCFMIAANQIGSHGGGYRSGGRSMIVDPWGIVLASAPDAEGAIVAQLDFDQLQAIRRRIPVLSHRREDVYGFAEAVAHPSGAAR
jgi:predicted amidohydrolase